MRGDDAVNVEVEKAYCLLLKVVQSVLERYPPCEPLACWMPREPPVPTCANEPVKGEEAVSVEEESAVEITAVEVFQRIG